MISVMPIAPTTAQSWLLLPPLDLPLTLRLENGRFGSLRPGALDEPPPCSTDQAIPADDPSNPTGGDVFYVNQIHEAVDLAASPGDCVFAAYSGRVVEVDANPAGTKGNVTIDHHPEGSGFVTKYNHVTDIQVADGDFVQKGSPFAAVSAEPEEPHLHFELWAVVDSATTAASWPGDGDLVPVDPTRALYSWEQRTADDAELGGGALAPGSIGVVRQHGVPFFSATLGSSTVHVPMYEPLSADERLLIDLLRDAYGNRDVTARFRTSSFWGLDVVTQVELT